MSEQDENLPNETAEVTPTPEPQGTLGEEAAAALSQESPKAALAKELTSEQLSQVERAISQAIDGAQKKWAERNQQELEQKGYMTPEQAKTIAQEEVKMAEERARAEANVSLWLRDHGIDPASDQAKQVVAEYREGLEAGRYTNKMLLDKKGIGYLVSAAGLAPSAEPAERKSVPMRAAPTNPEGKPLTRKEMAQHSREQNLKALEELQRRSR